MFCLFWFCLIGDFVSCENLLKFVFSKFLENESRLLRFNYLFFFFFFLQSKILKTTVQGFEGGGLENFEPRILQHLE